jgi:hypothetical protein
MLIRDVLLRNAEDRVRALEREIEGVHPDDARKRERLTAKLREERRGLSERVEARKVGH